MNKEQTEHGMLEHIDWIDKRNREMMEFARCREKNEICNSYEV